MKKASALTLIAFVLAAFGSNVFCATTTPVICAYVFTHGATLTRGQVDPHKLTCVNYAFANIEQGRMVEGASEAAGNLATLIALKHDNPDLKVIISVGGWLWSGGFSDMALTKASRAAFIDSALTFLKRYELDGLDIDWEFPDDPGAGHAFRPEDKQNYTLLVKELRTRFDAMQSQLHRHLYLTVAVGAQTDFLERTEMGEVQKYVDAVNLMAYDYYEPGDEKITGNHAPLFTNPDDPAHISTDRSVREYEQAGVPAAKIILGVPFYGHVWGQVPPKNHGLFQPGQPVPNAFADYGAIARSMLGQPGYTRYWDSAASVPFLYNASKQIFVSYEDPQSLALKSKYVLDHHLAGVMFWEYFGDDASGTLLNTLDATLHPTKNASAGKH
jgi:chitinase